MLRRSIGGEGQILRRRSTVCERIDHLYRLFGVGDAKVVGHDVVGNGEKPGAKRGVVVTRKGAQGFRERYARGVLRCLPGAEAPVTITRDGIEVAGVEEGEGDAGPQPLCEAANLEPRDSKTPTDRAETQTHRRLLVQSLPGLLPSTFGLMRTYTLRVLLSIPSARILMIPGWRRMSLLEAEVSRLWQETQQGPSQPPTRGRGNGQWCAKKTGRGRRQAPHDRPGGVRMTLASPRPPSARHHASCPEQRRTRRRLCPVP
jgi:hypothetical protein